MRTLLALFLLPGLAACTPMAVQDKPAVTSAITPEPTTSDAIPTAWRHTSTAESTPTAPWWQTFGDDQLNRLIDQALLANPELRVAEARMGEIEKITAESDPEEQAAAHAAMQAAANDTNAVRQATIHAVVSAYLDTRLVEQQRELLKQRMQWERELTEVLHKRLMAGITEMGTLRAQEQAGIETQLKRNRAHLDHQQSLIRLGLLLGMAPVEFSLAAGTYPSPDDIKVSVETPSSVLEHRQDVQAARQRLLAANTQQADDDADAATQIEQADNAPASREAQYRKSTLTALHDVELAIAAWHAATDALKASRDALAIQRGQTSNVQRAVAAGRASSVELLKTRLAENDAEEHVLLATHARNAAYAALQLAIGHD